jgi:energy-coupling factor transport system ATP-binding protein
MIEIKNLSFSYPGTDYILKQISLRIGVGEYVSIVGENGSGKSTLARHLNGLLLPGEGSVIICGMDTSDSARLPEIRRKVGMVFQDPMTQFVGSVVREDVAFGPSNLCMPRKKMLHMVDSTLENLGLAELGSRSPLDLSGGQMQLAAIAGVLAMQPECLVFDEAVSMLDSATRKKILALLGKLHSEGKTIIHITHRLEEARYAERVIALKKGEILYDGSTDCFLQSGKFREAGLGAPPLAELSFRLGQAGVLEEVAFDPERIAEGICRFRSTT